MEQTGNRCLFNHAKRLIVVLSAAVLFFGCEKREIYSQVITPAPMTVPACATAEVNGMPMAAVETAFAKEGIALSSACADRVRITKTHALCSLEKQKNSASAGVIRLELFNGETMIYRAQKEFWDESDRAILSDLITRMRKDSALKRP